MIVYKNTAKGFQGDVDSNQVANNVESCFVSRLGRKLNPSEKNAINNSMQFMSKIIRRADLSESCGVLLEYMIPSTSNRVDFLISGEDESGNKNFVIIELKQWGEAESTEKDGIVKTFVGGGFRDTTHPSYQAYSYKRFLKDYNENIDSGLLSPYSCAYLHNYIEKNPEPLKSEIYKSIIKESPLYFQNDYEKLEQFLHKYVRFGNGEDIIFQIESGKIRPSKKLINHVAKMYEGNQEFILLDEQKVAYEMALAIAKNTEEKSTVIIKGGPGTGKSVISVNLLGGLLKNNLTTFFVAPNSSFREVMIKRLVLAKKEGKLERGQTIERIKSLFKGSAGFVDAEKDIFDVLIVDEAHRLKKKGAYQYKGLNQIDDIIKSTKTSIFFVDDNQMIRPDDIGSVSEIKKIAQKNNSKIYEIELVAQFRCSGAEGYLNWIDNTLQIKNTANFDGWGQSDFEFKIFSDPNKLREAIKEKHNNKFNARILAGYAWKWTSAKKGNNDGQIDDVEIPEFDFKIPWNSRKIGTTWAVDPEGIHQAGCIHTSQGLEFDYVGVIVGNDLRFDPVGLEYYVDWKSYKDSTGKKSLKNKPEELVKLVKNIYKVLMSRGMKGCYVYFTDKETEHYFRSRLENKVEDKIFKKLESPYFNKYELVSVPLVGSAPCGTPLMAEENIEEMIMVEKSKIKHGAKYFIVKAEGDSMNKAGINSGDLVLCRASEKGETGDRVAVLLNGDKVAIKYYDKKDGRRILLPKSANPEHQPIIPQEGDMIQGIVQEVINRVIE
jgi:uncharacterized protein